MKHEPRRGILPSASTQAAIDLALADIARRMAYSQARRGVDPRTAARHGSDQAAALMAWLFFIAPVMALFTLSALASPLSLLIVAPLDAIGVLILIRIQGATVRRADERPVYALPTWLLVVVGGLYVCGIFLLMIVAVLAA